MSLAEQQQLEETYVMHTFGRKPVELVEGEGMVVRDDAGKEYLDFIAGIGAVKLGALPPRRRGRDHQAGLHAHPREQLLLHRASRAGG